ncbi:hypothetical protein HDU82_008701, partial [Entophlyctis luteolus]
MSGKAVDIKGGWALVDPSTPPVFSGANAAPGRKRRKTRDEDDFPAAQPSVRTKREKSISTEVELMIKNEQETLSETEDKQLEYVELAPLRKQRKRTKNPKTEATKDNENIDDRQIDGSEKITGGPEMAVDQGTGSHKTPQSKPADADNEKTIAAQKLNGAISVKEAQLKLPTPAESYVLIKQCSSPAISSIPAIARLRRRFLLFQAQKLRNVHRCDVDAVSARSILNYRPNPVPMERLSFKDEREEIRYDLDHDLRAVVTAGTDDTLFDLCTEKRFE